MITLQEGHMVPLPFGSFTDPETGRVRIRLVDTESSSYRVAREYMIRLDRTDLQDPGRLGPIATAAGLTPEAFRDRYGSVSGELNRPPPPRTRVRPAPDGCRPEGEGAGERLTRRAQGPGGWSTGPPGPRGRCDGAG